MLTKRGFLDAQGGQVPVIEMSARLQQQLDLGFGDATELPAQTRAAQAHAGGKKCPECGARSMKKVDGCDRCENCNYIGTCG